MVVKGCGKPTEQGVWRSGVIVLRFDKLLWRHLQIAFSRHLYPK